MSARRISWNPRIKKSEEMRRKSVIGSEAWTPKQLLVVHTKSDHKDLHLIPKLESIGKSRNNGLALSPIMMSCALLCLRLARHS